VAGRIIKAKPGDEVHFSVYGMAPWFVAELLADSKDVTLVVKDRHGKEITRVIG
jgi:hypothetical protein